VAFDTFLNALETFKIALETADWLCQCGLFALGVQKMKLEVGIIIIGSLYWDTHPSREHWRNSRLKERDEFSVKVPIRYGRKSDKRGNTYTMVFSRSSGAGQGKVVRCQREISSAEELGTEAEALWTAERSSIEANGTVSAQWGGVGLLARPGALIQPELLDSWARRVGREQTFTEQDPGITVNNRGILQIDWPCLLNSPDQVPVDLLLATATKPTLIGAPPRFATAPEIADAWNRDQRGNVSYFWSNRKSGILTFQDEDIQRCLEKR
jgi:hypothetical protein